MKNAGSLFCRRVIGADGSNRVAPIDERGCRRDIRSNGWTVAFEGFASWSRSSRRNKFSSFGADPSQGPQFHGARSRRNLVLTCSPTPSFLPWETGDRSAFLLLPEHRSTPDTTVVMRPPRAAGASGRLRSQPLQQRIIGSRLSLGSPYWRMITAEGASAQIASGMVIVVRSRRVNRTSRSGRKPCKAGISCIGTRKPAPCIYPRFIAPLKLPFKFEWS